jgi:hypothetical protein
MQANVHRTGSTPTVRVANRLSFSQSSQSAPDYPSVSGSDDHARLFKSPCLRDGYRLVFRHVPLGICRFLMTEDDLYDRI